jgi:hypothetical protein
LETRQVLSGPPSGTWIGQDGHDLVGSSSTAGPDGVQDIHVALSGLPAGNPVAFADIQGLGGGEWQFHGQPGGPWAAALVQGQGATTADLYFDPTQVENGRPFSIQLTYADGTTSSLWVQGGTADPNLRMPDASLAAKWLGQDGHDLTGPGASVGPDGLQDVHLALTGLAANVPITAATIVGPGGETWAFGLNPTGDPDAELVRSASDPTRGDFYFSPKTNLAGGSLSLTITYADGHTDSATLTAGATDPSLAMPAPAPLPIAWNGVTAQWSGQDGAGSSTPGLAHVAVSGLPAGRSIVAAALTDGVAGSWSFANVNAATGSFIPDPNAAPLTVAQGGGSANLSFAPVRSEAGTTLTLRLLLDDGTTVATQFAGGAADPGLVAPLPESTSIVAHPGDDLNALANQYGTVHLAPGTYTLTQALVLNSPVTISADPGTTLLFSQPQGAAPWSAAIKINAGHTTLEGFTVRFSGPVNWASNVSYGPAVIGTTDNLDAGPNLAKPAITIADLDLQGPPVPAGSSVEAPRLMRLVTATSGIVTGNTLDGGTTEFIGGPWQITKNRYIGTPSGTFTYAIFAGHQTHDLVLSDNSAQPAAGSGKAWRFLVLTDSGVGDVVKNNVAVGVGPQDTDTTSANAAEVVLTEAYQIHFEGTPSAISADGRVLQINNAQGTPARAGDVVAILSGPDAGRWFRIAQAIGPDAFLMADPLPRGSYAISISTGFVNETYQNNTIDTRGSSVAADMVLLGNQFGTRVVGNQLLGGNQALLLSATPTEQPVLWGWSHSPAFGAVVSGNTITDAITAITLNVRHDVSTIKSDAGRVYLTAAVVGNTIAWSPSFLAARAKATGTTADPTAITIGDPGALDPRELVAGLSRNELAVPAGDVPGPALLVNDGLVNGQTLVAQSLSLPTVPPAAPAALALVNDTGISATDGITSDARLRFAPVSGAVGYEYSVNGSTSYVPLAASTTFLPAGLVQGSNTVAVRAFDATGHRGAGASIHFTFDNVVPHPAPPTLAPGNDSGLSANDNVTNVTSPTFLVSGSSGDYFTLVRDGLAVAMRQGPGPLSEPSTLPDGTHAYNVIEADPAGNTGTSSPTFVTIQTRPPAAVGSLTVTPDGHIVFQGVAGTVGYEYQATPSGPEVPIGVVTSFIPSNIPAALDTIAVRAIDAAGNVGPAATVAYDNRTFQPSGVWLGQDGHDLVGPYPVAVPDGSQDVHVALSGLNPYRTITYLEVDGLGGGQWTYNGPWGPWKAALVRAPGATTADLYFQPSQAETGRPYSITLRYDDGTTASFWVQGGTALPHLADVPTSPRPTALTLGVPHPAGTVATRHARFHRANATHPAHPSRAHVAQARAEHVANHPRARR